MLISNCGISREVCQHRYYAAEESDVMFRKSGIKLNYFNEGVLNYSDTASETAEDKQID